MVKVRARQMNEAGVMREVVVEHADADHIRIDGGILLVQKMGMNKAGVDATTIAAYPVGAWSAVDKSVAVLADAG